MAGILRITDGTRKVTLLANLAGMFTDSWIPQSSQAKGGGVWGESPFTNGRQLVMRTRQNVIDTWNLILRNAEQDTSIKDAKLLIDLLEDGLEYWTCDWQAGSVAKPVWIEYRGECETNTSYAYIYDYSWPSLSDPHNNPFRSGVADNITLVIEHGEWRSNAPSNNNENSIYAGNTYTALGATQYGTSSSQQSTEFLKHFSTLKYVNANLSHVYRYDASAGNYTNLLGIVAPTTLFEIPVQVNDAVYYGACTTQIPFDSVVHTLSTVGDGNVTTQLEYWNGAWVSIPTASGNPEFYPSDIFDGGVAGTYAVTWERLTDWAVTAVNGINGYWVRIRVTVVTVAPVSVPTQSNTQQIYSVQWPWIEIDDEEIAGDYPALLKFYMGQIPHRDSFNQADMGQCNRIVIGAWRMDRGNSFVEYLNCANNNSGIAVGGTAVSTTLSTSPSGVVRRYSPAGAAVGANIVTWTITTNANDWRGQFRAFVRYIFTSGASVALKLGASPNSAGFGTLYTSTQYTNTPLGGAGTRYILDLGTITIGTPGEEDIGAVLLELVATTTAASSIDIIDIVLVPIDDTNLEIQTIRVSEYPSYVIVHNSTTAKPGAYSQIINYTTGALDSSLITRILGLAELQRRTHYRLFHFGWYDDVTSGESFDICDGTFTHKLNSVSQYDFARGTE